MGMQRRAVSLGLAAALAALSACKRSNDAPGAQASTAAGESDSVPGPDARPGVTAGAARLVLPAVPGRPGVVYFRVANNTHDKITLAGVFVQGVGKAEMHRTSGGQMAPVDHVDIAPGGTIAFAPGGLHVMAFGILPGLAAGAQSELTLTFADGDKISLPLKIEAMGADSASGGMAGMSH